MKKFSHLIQNLENFALKRPRPKLFVNKNAIKSNFENYTNKVGNFQIGWERLREFGHWALEFLRFGSSLTDADAARGNVLTNRMICNRQSRKVATKHD